MRDNQFNIKLDSEQVAKLEKLCQQAKRTPSNLLYLLIAQSLDKIDIEKVNDGLPL